MRKELTVFLAIFGILASSCGSAEPGSAGVAESPVDVNTVADAASGGDEAGGSGDPAPSTDDDGASEVPVGGQVVPGIDNAALAEELLLDDSILEGRWTATTSDDDDDADVDALAAETVMTLPECEATEATFGADVLSVETLGDAPAAAAESPTYESAVLSTVVFGAEVHLDPTEPGELIGLLDEVGFEVCLTLVAEDVFIELFANDPAITVLPLSSRRLRVPESDDDVLAIELIVPLEITGAEAPDLRMAFLFAGRGGVLLSAVITHEGEVDVDAVLLAMLSQLDEVLGA